MILFISYSALVFAEIAVTYHDRQSKQEWSILKDVMMSWNEAKAACPKLGKGWKLPSKNEFEQSLPKLMSFPEIAKHATLSFWSETPYEEDKFVNGRVYGFANGKIELRDRYSDGEPINYPVACVRKDTVF